MTNVYLIVYLHCSGPFSQFYLELPDFSPSLNINTKSVLSHRDNVDYHTGKHIFTVIH